jgi:hypothetical protein
MSETPCIIKMLKYHETQAIVFRIAYSQPMELKFFAKIRINFSNIKSQVLNNTQSGTPMKDVKNHSNIV